MSLWTPEGEHPVDRGRPSAAPADDLDDVVGALEAILANLPDEQREELQAALAELTPEQRQEYVERLLTMAETQQQVVDTPIEVMVGNHAAGFYELLLAYKEGRSGTDTHEDEEVGSDTDFDNTAAAEDA